MTNRVFDNDTEFAISTTGETLTSLNAFRNRWSENVVESLRQSGLFGSRFDVPGDTPPSDTSLIWTDTSGQTTAGQEPPVYRYFNTATATWDTANFFNIWEAAAGGTDAVEAVTSRTTLKALDTSAVTAAVLKESGREGVFIWTLGDFSTEVTADTQEAIYIASDGTASNVGAWIRDVSDHWDIKWFGAVGDGVTDDTTEIQAAIDLLPAEGGRIFFPPGDYVISSTITVGDGTNTTISTKTGVHLCGFGGVGDGEFGTPRDGTRIVWGGAASSAAMIQFNGPISSCVVEHILFDANDLCDWGIELVHIYKCRFTKVQVEKYRQRAWNTRSIVGPLFSGITQGFFDNVFDQCTARNPTTTAAETGFYADGNATNNVGWSRNHFRLCDFAIGGDSGTRAIYLGLCDNNTFDRVFTFYSAGVTDGVGVFFDQTGPTGAETLFPHENLFLNCPLIGGVGGTSGTGGNLFIGYPTADGEPVPTIDDVRGFTYDGVFFGSWAGSVVPWAGKVEPSGGLGNDSTTKYIVPIGLAATQPTRFAAEVIVPSGQKLVRFRTNLGVSPGGSATRAFSVQKNGVNQAASTFYNSGESGDRGWTLVSGINFNGGDTISIESFVGGTGSAANSGLNVSLEFAPLETL